MKHNLKNRPRKLVTKHSSVIYLSNQKARDVEAWFDGFEKELRERLDFSYADAPQPLERCRRYAQIFKEILGEVEKEAKP